MRRRFDIRRLAHDTSDTSAVKSRQPVHERWAGIVQGRAYLSRVTAGVGMATSSDSLRQGRGVVQVGE